MPCHYSISTLLLYHILLRNGNLFPYSIRCYVKKSLLLVYSEFTLPPSYKKINFEPHGMIVNVKTFFLSFLMYSRQLIARYIFNFICSYTNTIIRIERENERGDSHCAFNVSLYDRQPNIASCIFIINSRIFKYIQSLFIKYLLRCRNKELLTESFVFYPLLHQVFCILSFCYLS